MGWALASSNFHRKGSNATAPASSTSPRSTPAAPSQEPRKAFLKLDAELANTPHYKTEIVIAHYNDNLSWVSWSLHGGRDQIHFG